MLVPLRPSNEHILIVRVPGAQDQCGCPSNPFIVGACEQEGWLSAPSHPSATARCASTEDHQPPSHGS